MGADRVIKTDGDLDITATDTSVSGTLTVSGQSTLSGLTYPTADGTADQVLTTNGSGALSFATVSGGYDEITSNTEAGSYSGTARIIYITASENVVFTSALSDRIIINKNDYEVKFQADVTNCIIQSDNNIEIENTSDDTTTTVNIKYSKINCNNLEINASGDETGNDMTVEGCEINCRGNFTFAGASLSEYAFIKNNLYCGGNFITGSGVNIIDIILSNVNVKKLQAQISLPSTDGDSEFRARSGTATSASSVSIKGQSYILGTYSVPFVATYEGVKTEVALLAKLSSSQSISSSTATEIDFGATEIDNTSSFDTLNNRFTTPVKGKYLLSVKAYLTGITSGGSIEVHIDGVNDSLSAIYFSTVGNGTASIANGSVILDLDRTDTVELFVNSFSDTSYTVSTITTFCLNKIN